MTGPKAGASRRNFLRVTGSAAAASAFSGMAVPLVHAAEENEIQVALIGCGGRGTGAANNALSVQNGPIKLVAMADVFEAKLKDSFESLTSEDSEVKDKVDVPDDRKFIGFDGYKKAMDLLKPGDVVILTTPPAFRWPMFQYAIEKGLHTFMEKPVTVDGPTSKRMLELGKKAEEKNLKVGVGLMCRHCDARQQLHDRIQDGEIGDIILMRAYRQQKPVGHAIVPPKPDDFNELLYQIQEFHGFLWASGGCYSDFNIHNIDECCWMKDAWPVQASGTGARTYRGDAIDQNFDTYSVEYTFGDGTKMLLEGRNMDGCHQEFASYAHGSKGSAVISTASHTPARCKIFPNQKISRRDRDATWAYPQPEPNPYQLEWDHLIAAIREDRPYNEVERGVMASAVTSMGRMAAHTGQVVTLDDLMDCPHEFAPGVAELTFESSAPLMVDSTGHYPWPEPGIKIDREF